MVKEIAIYIEGGGDQRDTKNKLREGIGTFLNELREIARSSGIRWKIVACGSRNDAYDDFCTALSENPQAFNVLLVDSEEAIIADGTREYHKLPWKHLSDRDNWERPSGVNNIQCFLMVECMEAWLLADRANLQKYYGAKFAANALPRNQNVEAIHKPQLYDALRRATQKCSSPYHKTRHAFDILRSSDPQTVRNAAPHCERLFDILSRQMGGRVV